MRKGNGRGWVARLLSAAAARLKLKGIVVTLVIQNSAHIASPHVLAAQLGVIGVVQALFHAPIPKLYRQYPPLES